MSVATLPPALDQSAGEPPEEAWPSWLVPPTDGFTSADLDKLPGLPPHTELLNGSLVFVSPQRRWHSLAKKFIWSKLREAAPSGWYVDMEMSVKVSDRNRPEPDVIVFNAAAESDDLSESFYNAEDVLLVVEVVSPESVERDHEVKPRKYAAAGIRHYWLVEQDGVSVAVYAYELDPVGKVYLPPVIQHDHVKLPAPFPIDIDFAEMRDYR
jgi:Uma2 family endonuclease